METKDEKGMKRELNKLLAKILWDSDAAFNEEYMTPEIYPTEVIWILCGGNILINAQLTMLILLFS